MSDPVTNMQIEDVLSSIRKLVSESTRDEAVPKAAAAPAKRESEGAQTGPATAQAAATQPDRLLLTPALRVEEAEPDADGAEEATLAAALAESWPDTPQEDLRQIFVPFDADDDGVDYGEEAPMAEGVPSDDRQEAVVTNIMSLLNAARSALDAVTEDKVTATRDPLLRAQEELRRLSTTIAPIAASQSARASDRDDVADPEEMDDVIWTGDAEMLDSDGDEVLRQGAAARRFGLESRIAELEAAVALSPDEWEPNGAEEDIAELPEEDVLPWATQLDPEAVLADADQDATAQVVFADLPAGDALDSFDEEAADDVPPEELMTDETLALHGDGAMDEGWEEADAWEDVAPAALRPEAALDLSRDGTQEPSFDEGLDEEFDSDPAGDGWAAMPDAARSLEDTLAAAAFAAAYSATVEAAETGITTGVAPALAEAPVLGGAVDREELRALVSEIVRQELQGALGERITRNVRKLVRREIHRALISQDLI